MHRPWYENQFDGAESVDCPPATRRLTDHYSVKNIELHWSPARSGDEVPKPFTSADMCFASIRGRASGGPDTARLALLLRYPAGFSNRRSKRWSRALRWVGQRLLPVGGIVGRTEGPSSGGAVHA
jgi:hypothetical protein